MTKIVLIKCEAINKYSYALAPPLGVMYLAAVLRQAGHDVKIYDTRFSPGNYDQILSDVAEFHPHVVGLSALAYEADSMHNIASALKQQQRNIKIIVGGPFPFSNPEDVLGNPQVDSIVIGEGELTLPELIHVYQLGGTSLQDVKGIAYREGTEIKYTPPRPAIEDLDGLPFPAWDLIDIEKYRRSPRTDVNSGKRYMVLFSSRGCPYGCIYCHKHFGRKFRPRSPESVVSEMEVLARRYHINEFEFADDIFNLDEDRAEKICDLLLEKGLKVTLSFPNGLRCDRLSRKLLQKLKAAGTRDISVAIETGSPRLQKYIGKNADIEKINTVIGWLAELKIRSRGFFMIGFPTETREEILKTIDFARQSKLDTAYFFQVTPFEGTRLAELCPGMSKKYTDLFIFGSSNLTDLPDEEFYRLHKLAVKKFYTLPRLWNLFRYHPSNKFQLLKTAPWQLRRFFR